MKMLIIDGVKYKLWTPKDEEREFHPMVRSCSKEIFGKDSLYFDVRHVLRTASGIGSIPDAYVISLSRKEWYVVENELASHPIYDHIVKQLTKFINGIRNQNVRSQIIDMLYEEINKDTVLRATVQKHIGSTDIYHFLSKLVSKSPRIVIIIDQKTSEIEEACRVLKYQPDIIEFKTYVRENAENVHAHLFEPIYFQEMTLEENKRSSASKKAWKTRKFGVGIPAEEQINKIVNIQAREIARKLREEIKNISENIEERTTKDHINFWVSGSIFASIYPEKNGFCFDVKIPPNQLSIKNLDVRENKSRPKWSFITIKKKIELNLLIEAARQAYEKQTYTSIHNSRQKC